MRFWPDCLRRQWAIKFVLTGPDRAVLDRYVSPSRWWTRGGAEAVAVTERRLYRADPVLRDRVTLTAFKAGPFRSAGCLDALDKVPGGGSHPWMG